MGQVRILAEEVANRIAAGEVVERPYSVVKELVENAIDAKATAIGVSIENGGKKLIKVTDNGTGMPEDDALSAFERHATSKIREVEDIFNISTLGFRGEALPSIASVAHLTLVTRQKEDELATKVEFLGGKLKDVSKTAANAGTTITVENLFYNVPARRKFLKSEQTELKHIITYLHYQMISYPGIQFKLEVNGQQKLFYQAQKDSLLRLSEIFGIDFQVFIQVESANGGFKLHGQLGIPDQTEKSSSELAYFFVNGRFIKDRLALHALRTAYEPFIKKNPLYGQNGKLPPYILHLEAAPHDIDVNVHPAKLEIRFREPQQMYAFVKTAITTALISYEEGKFSTAKNAVSYTTQNYNSGKVSWDGAKSLYQPDIFSSAGEPAAVLSRESEIENVNPWQLHNSYILVQVEDGLLFIDQHAAHERILYEKFIARAEQRENPGQKLFFPVVVDLPPFKAQFLFDLIDNNQDTFNNVGFNIKAFSGNSVVIDEIPPEVDQLTGQEIFLEILELLSEEMQITHNFIDALAKSVSCKAAVKAGQKLHKEEMFSIINELFACHDPYFCPHGRPLMFTMDNEELFKRFRRT